MLADWVANFLALVDEGQGRLLAAAALSCVATAALLYSLPLRAGRRIPTDPASFFLLGEITSRTRLWGIGLLSALPMWVVFFAVALAAPAAFEEAKRLSRQEFGVTVKKALGNDLWASVERVLNDIPPLLDPSVTAFIVIVLLLPHVIAAILYYRELVSNFFALEHTASSRALEMANAVFGPGPATQTDALQDKLSARLGHPCPIPPELAKTDSWRLILAYQALYCAKDNVKKLGIRRAIEELARDIGVDSAHPPSPLPKLDLGNVMGGLVIFITLAAMYVVIVPQFALVFSFLPAGSWPAATAPGRLGIATSIVQNAFSIIIPFVIGLYRHQSLVAGIRSRIDRPEDVRMEYWRLFRQTAALVPSRTWLEFGVARSPVA